MASLPNPQDILATNPQTLLAAMITPAVLISACGSLILATSERLTRSVARAREISISLTEISEQNDPEGLREEERRMLFRQLDFTTTRSRLLQRALSRLYAAVGVFVGTSVAIGIVALTGKLFTIVPIVLALVGGALLLYAAVVLVKESRFSLAALNAEMDFVWKRGQELGPEDLVELGPVKNRLFRGPK
jgi:hypothetical protein